MSVETSNNRWRPVPFRLNWKTEFEHQQEFLTKKQIVIDRKFTNFTFECQIPLAEVLEFAVLVQPQYEGCFPKGFIGVRELFILTFLRPNIDNTFCAYN